ncbi:TPA: hypothetical protein NHT88_003528 [Providencia rettgeri]|uniref:hypothetical protein n=1 Tax=Providencia TaxID=586 RepID=UPI00234A695F|nr:MULTISPECIES: hypothetical protein [unclassified Providencia]ELR5140235.1 hypothetical protein [Providencia rettgeri]HCH7937360.1 hypothetical protein [Providencia rettgeri]
MKGTTLTELSKAYQRQGRFIASRYILNNIEYYRDKVDLVFFDHGLEADKLTPRGKAYQRIVAIENAARTKKFKALQEKMRQREASNAGN